MVEFKAPRNGQYYDLVQIPSGHFPVSKISRFYSWIPMLVGDDRDNELFICPNCGKKSFFSISDPFCTYCIREIDIFHRHGMRGAHDKREKKRKMRKSIEHFFLPILILLGIARYNSSVRRHPADYAKEMKKQTYPKKVVDIPLIGGSLRLTWRPKGVK